MSAKESLRTLEIWEEKGVARVAPAFPSSFAATAPSVASSAPVQTSQAPRETT